jgi:thymidylate synthase ThyX
MAFAARILADSLAPSTRRLTTFEITYPRCIHSEIMTHRILSKNAASSRAIPTEKLIARVLEDPFVPETWGKNQKGMQADEELSDTDKDMAHVIWLLARDQAVAKARALVNLGLHKQIANRVIEPWMWITVIISGTTWTNWFGLRDHKDAEPHFQKIAKMMRELYEASMPRELKLHEWHLPLWGFEGDEEEAKIIAATEGSPEEGLILTRRIARKVSVGRCARVSYLTHDGRRDLREDILLHDRLMNANPGHWSPFEHIAKAEGGAGHRSGNFFGWTQYRKTFEQEHIGERMP